MLEPLEPLIRALVRLPGIGRRTAERIAVRLARDRSRSLAHELVSALRELETDVRCCSRCGAITTAANDPCALCTDPRRQGDTLCVVEDASDIEPIERSGAFRGRYHALMGKLSPMRGESAASLRLEDLRRRIEREGIVEVILALNTDVESDATAAFIREELAPLKVRVTRLAVGLPAGSGIAYSDPVTLSAALQGRRPL
jgi:recombination protein RecR